MELVIPERLPRLNEYINAERRNRFLAAKIKRDNTELVRLYALKLSPITTPAWYTFTWHLKNARSDPDNISFGTKFLMDGLVKANKLPNDNLKYVVGITHEFIVDGSDKVVIQITPVN